MSDSADTTATPPRRRWLYWLPLVAFIALGAVLLIGLGRDPEALPSALLGRAVPSFSLPPLEGRGEGWSDAELRTGKPQIVNVFASWCVPCRIEHPVLMGLKERGVTINAINYKDEPAKANAFLDEMGNPYARIGADRNGRVAIDWGVYGVPETFVVDGQGRIVFRFPGPLTPDVLNDKVLPALGMTP